MTDIEIDRALALAIGWKDEPNKMRVSNVFGLQVWIGYWANFRYRDWNVIGPVAERYEMFPYRLRITEERGWNVFTYKDNVADTPQKAIALAVIGAKK
jgi:hypothetical protein